MTTSNTGRSVFRRTTLTALGASTIAKTTETFQKHRRYRIGFTLLLALVLAYAGTFGTVRGAPDSSPILTRAAVTDQELGTVNIAGTAFTPGGMVYVAIYDQWGATLHETRWVAASDTVYGRNGSIDPAAGFDRGGTLNEEFENLCGTMTMVRAYDQQTDTWSNWMDIDASAAGTAGTAGTSSSYGGNGSIDQELGFRSGC